MNFKNNILFKQNQLLMICISILVFNLSYSILVPIIPNFFDSLGMSTVMIGYIMSLYAVSKAICQVPSGMISDLIGDKKVLVVCLSLLCMILFSYTVFNISIIISIIYILEGAVTGMAYPAIYSILSRSVDEGRRGESVGVFTTFSSLGVAIGPLLSGIIISIFKEYDLAFYVSSIGSLITALLVFINIKKISTDIKIEKNDFNKSNNRIKNKLKYIGEYKLGWDIVMLGCIALLGDFVEGFMISIFPIYSNRILNLSITYVSVMLSVNFCIFSLSASFAGRISDKIGDKKQIVYSLIVISLAFLSLFFVRPIYLFTIIMLVESLAAVFLYSALQSALSKLGNNDIKGVIFGFVGTFQSIGLALGPIVSVFLYEYKSNCVFLGLSTISILVLFIFIFINRIILKREV